MYVGVQGADPHRVGAALAAVEERGRTSPTRLYLAAGTAVLAAVVAVVVFALGRAGWGVLLPILAVAAAAVAMSAARARREARRVAEQDRQLLSDRVSQAQQQAVRAAEAYQTATLQTQEVADHLRAALARIQAAAPSAAGSRAVEPATTRR